jgi:hypothetical protein
MYSPLAAFDVVQMKLYENTKVDVDAFVCYFVGEK